MADLPPGWGDRHNQMSERDMQLGGMAATKFGGTASRSAYENDASGDGDYKNSDQVRQFYLDELQNKQKAVGGEDDRGPSSVAGSMGEGGGDNNVPEFWVERQMERDLYAKQMGVFSKDGSIAKHREKSKAAVGDGDGDGSLSAERALVQIATHTLEKMAMSLEIRDGVKIPITERAAFAKAVKGAMDALARHQ